MLAEIGLTEQLRAAATARAEAAERERDEARQLLRDIAAILNPHETYDATKILGWARDTVEQAREADEAQAHAADLRGALEKIRPVVLAASKSTREGYRDTSMAFPLDVEFFDLPTLEGEAGITALASLNADLDRTPAQSLGRVKAEVLTEVMRKVCAVAVQTEERESRTFSWSEAAALIHDEADRLKKEASNG